MELGGGMGSEQLCIKKKQLQIDDHRDGVETEQHEDVESVVQEENVIMPDIV